MRNFIWQNVLLTQSYKYDSYIMQSEHLWSGCQTKSFCSDCYYIGAESNIFCGFRYLTRSVANAFGETTAWTLRPARSLDNWTMIEMDSAMYLRTSTHSSLLPD